MILATVKIEDFDRFWNTFSTKGAEKRKGYGSKDGPAPSTRTPAGLRRKLDPEHARFVVNCSGVGYRHLFEPISVPGFDP